MYILEPVEHILIGSKSIDGSATVMLFGASYATFNTSDTVDYAVGDFIYNGAGVVFSGIHEYT